MKSTLKIGIVIPMYNEEAIAQQSLQTILEYVRKLSPEATIIIVNDGSIDKTEFIINGIIEELDKKEVILINHQVNLGYGTALRSGILYAIGQGYDYLIFMDSDLTNHPKYLSDFYTKISEGWDYIKATRYVQGGQVVGVPFRYRLLSTVGNFIARKLYGLPLTDITNGFRAVRVELFKHMNLRENDFAIILEELCQAKKLTQSFTELPYILTSRLEGQGKTRFSYTLKTCLRYLRYAIKSRRLAW